MTAGRPGEKAGMRRWKARFGEESPPKKWSEAAESRSMRPSRCRNLNHRPAHGGSLCRRDVEILAAARCNGESCPPIQGENSAARYGLRRVRCASIFRA